MNSIENSSLLVNLLEGDNQTIPELIGANEIAGSTERTVKTTEELLKESNEHLE